MSCWVVPSIAAEFWRIPLDQVMDKLRRHAVPTRQENGFTFIDILPDPAPARPATPPPTFTAAPPVSSHSAIRNPQSEIPGDCVSTNIAWRRTSSQRRRPRPD